jgi:hypothetical protein
MGKDKKKRKYHRDDNSGEEADARKSRKDVTKKAAKVAKMLGYTNETNPFGDSNLLQPFVWGKKVAKEKEEKRPVERDTEEQRLQLLQDISRVRKRREDREKELEEMERLRAEEQRLREAALYGDWQEKEEDFHLEQMRVRSKLRLVRFQSSKNKTRTMSNVNFTCVLFISGRLIIGNSLSIFLPRIFCFSIVLQKL